jgi:hypothetical protein
VVGLRLEWVRSTTVSYLKQVSPINPYNLQVAKVYLLHGEIKYSVQTIPSWVNKEYVRFLIEREKRMLARRIASQVAQRLTDEGKT